MQASRDFTPAKTSRDTAAVDPFAPPGENESGHWPDKGIRPPADGKGFEDMFFLSITRHGVARRLDAPVVREHNVAGWVVTTATDGWLSTCGAGGPDGAAVTVTEAAPSAREPIPFVRVKVSDAPLSIDLTKELVGGRQVLYHVSPDGGFYCASHARLLKAAGVALEEDPDRLPEFFTYRYVTAPRTLFKNIDQMLPGERLRLEFDGRAWRRAGSQLYDPPRPPTPGARNGNGDRDASDHVDRPDRCGDHGARTAAALREAMRPLSHRPDRVHVLLSGGLDSSVLYEIARQDLGITDSYSTSYPFEPEENDRERQYALSAADAMGARHRHFVPTTRQFLRGVIEAVFEAEEPVVHLQSVLLLLLFRHALPPEGTIVSGDGADVIFGQKIHRQVAAVDKFWERHPRVARSLRPLVSPVLLPLVSSRPVVEGTRWALRRLRRASDVIDLVSNRWEPGWPLSDPRHVLWRPGAVRSGDWVRSRFGASDADAFATRAQLVAHYRDRPILDQLALLGFLASAATSQRVWSKLAEATGKSMYYAFSALPVMDCAFSTPWPVKVAEPKGVLRGAARLLGVPEFVISRPKADFNADPSRWSVRGSALEPLVPLAAKAWDEDEIRRVQTPRWADAHQFFAMLNYAIWKRLFIDGEPLDALAEELDRSCADAPAPAGATV